MLHAKPSFFDNIFRRVLSMVLCLVMLLGMVTWLAPEVGASNYTGTGSGYYYYAGYSDLTAALRKTTGWNGFSSTVSTGGHSNAMRITTTYVSNCDRYFFLGTGNTSYSPSSYPYMLLLCSASVADSSNQAFLLNNSLGYISTSSAAPMATGSIGSAEKLFYLLFPTSGAGSTNVGGIRFDILNSYTNAGLWLDIYGFAFLTSNAESTIENCYNSILSHYSGIFTMQINVVNDGSWTKTTFLHFVAPYGDIGDTYYPTGSGDSLVHTITTTARIDNQVIGWCYAAFVQYYSASHKSFAGDWTAGSGTTFSISGSANYINQYNNSSGNDGTAYMKSSFIVGCVTPNSTAVYNLIPNWNIATYTATFKNWDGTTLKTQSVSAGGTPTAPSNPTRPTSSGYAYTFSGWSPAVGAIYSNTTYTAQYSEKYQLAVSNGTNITASSTLANGYYAYGTQVTITATPATGYHFTNWSNGSTSNPLTVTLTGPFGVNPVAAANTYTVVYNGNGATGGSTASSTHTYDSAKALTANGFSKTGYSFAGWATSASGNVVYSNGASVTNLTSTNGATVTLYAKWTANTYTVTWNGNGGTPSATSTNKTYGSQIGTLPTASRTGYTFNGWYTATSGGSKIETTTTVTANVTYYAQWTVNTYTVTWNGNGGTPSVTSTNKTYGSQIGTLPTASRTGYTFNGWYTATSGGSKIETTTTVTANVTYYAQWTVNQYTYNIVYKSSTGASLGTATATYNYGTTNTISPKAFTGYTSPSSQNVAWDDTNAKTITFTYTPITYSITYNLNDGTNPSGAVSSYNIETATFNLPTPTRTGYTFGGWYTSSEFSGTAVTQITKGSTGNQTFYAKWTINKYTVTWKNDDGTVLETDQNVPYGTTPTYDGATPTKTGDAQYSYTFASWSPAISAVTGDTVYTAVFTQSVNKYTVTWKAWSDTQNAITVVKTETLEYGSTPTPPTDIDRLGYTFTAWSTDVAPVTGDIVYTAQYSNNSYNIVFNFNGGGSTAGVKDPYNDDVKYDLGECSTVEWLEPFRTGYTFNGWYDAESGGTKVYDADGKWVSGEYWSEGGSWLKTEGAEFYAQWTPNTYTVKFNANGGSGTMADQSFTYDEEQGLLTNAFTRSGYKFIGWSTDSSATAAQYTDKQSVKNLTADNGGTVTLYAVWELDQITVTFNGNGGLFDGNETTTQSYTIGGTFGSFPVPVKSYYSVEHWCTNASCSAGAGCGNAYTVDSIVPETGLTLYAQWTPIVYTITYDANGGVAVPSQTYTYEDTVTVPATTRVGYTFKSWLLIASDSNAWGTVNDSRPGAKDYDGKHGNITLQAVWEANTYTVVYNGNGYTGGSMTPSTHTYDISEALTTNGFTKEYHDFKGWATTADGEVAYNDGASVKNLTATDGGSVTLYAVWSPTVYTITFDENDGSEVADITYTYETEVFNLPTTTRDGYSLYKWRVSAADSGANWGTVGSNEIPFGEFRPNELPKRGNITLKAVWNKHFTFTFDDNVDDDSVTGMPTTAEGTILEEVYEENIDQPIEGLFFPSSTEGTFGTIVIPADTPVREGYIFVGWHSIAASDHHQCSPGNEYNNCVGDSGTLYAIWKIEEYISIQCFNTDGYQTYINDCWGFFGTQMEKYPASTGDAINQLTSSLNATFVNDSAFYKDGYLQLELTGTVSDPYIWFDLPDYTTTADTKLVIAYRTNVEDGYEAQLYNYNALSNGIKVDLIGDGNIHYAVFDFESTTFGNSSVFRFDVFESFNEDGTVFPAAGTTFDIFSIGICEGVAQAEFFGKRAVTDAVLALNDYVVPFTGTFMEVDVYSPSVNASAITSHDDIWSWQNATADGFTPNPLDLSATFTWDGAPVKIGYAFENWDVTAPDYGRAGNVISEETGYSLTVGAGAIGFDSTTGYSSLYQDPTYAIWSTGSIGGINFDITALWDALFGSLKLNRPEGLDAGQSFIFTIMGDENDDNTKNISVTVVSRDLDGDDDCVVIDNVPIGTYHIAEWDNWSWRYSSVKVGTAAADMVFEKLIEAGVENTVDYAVDDTAVTTVYAWLSGDSYSAYRNDDETQN